MFHLVELVATHQTHFSIRRYGRWGCSSPGLARSLLMRGTTLCYHSQHMTQNQLQHLHVDRVLRHILTAASDV